ncbi:heme peroxidase family protein [Desertibaculum subflavum]|uniref:heme peroxidase family protein n=1 Tax=Desertibaculum subflavum TaxID=2268458 RepID=UPI0034D2B51C
MRHIRKHYMVVGEGMLSRDEAGKPVCYRAPSNVELREFRFSRLGPKGKPASDALCLALGEAMTKPGNQPDAKDPIIPAGFTYLGQFVDHDMTFDRTELAFGSPVTVEELVQARSPALDLDCLYGRGPGDPEDRMLYSDGVRLKMGKTAAVPFPDGGTNRDIDGYDLPRSGQGATPSARRAALIADPRNDENLIVGQTHLAMMRFHNRVVEKLAAAGTPSHDLFERAREQTTKHYQWMLRHDFLDRICSPGIVDEVFSKGRKYFEVPCQPGTTPASYMQILPGDAPTMPIEFSVAAYRLGHSMIRGAYQWNRVFKAGGPGGVGTLDLLFRFSGTSGTLSPPPPAGLDDRDAGTFERLPTNWVADFRRLYNFENETDRKDLGFPNPDAEFNMAKRIDTLLVDPLKTLPIGSFGGNPSSPPNDRNLAFRNLVRGNMVELASGQQMAKLLNATPLAAGKIIEGAGGADVTNLDAALKKELTDNTPLWFYILREAELNNGRLGDVGSRIVAETFHRAMEASRYSIVRDPTWRPSLGPDASTFRMTDLLLFAFEGKKDLLNPLGDAAP